MWGVTAAEPGAVFLCARLRLLPLPLLCRRLRANATREFALSVGLTLRDRARTGNPELATPSIERCGGLRGT